MRVARSMAVGGVAFITQTIIFELLGVLLQVVSLSTAVVIGAEVGILTNFYLNNRFSFSDRHQASPLLSRLIRFHAVVSGSVLLQWLFVHAAESRTTDYLVIHAAYFTAVSLGFIWNYTFYLLFVWKEPSTLTVPNAVITKVS
jgi:putative flippase GtrA